MNWFLGRGFVHLQRRHALSHITCGFSLMATYLAPSNNWSPSLWRSRFIVSTQHPARSANCLWVCSLWCSRSQCMKVWGMIIFLGISCISNNNFVQGDTNTGDSICNHINDDKCFTSKSNHATLFFSFSNQDKGNTSSVFCSRFTSQRHSFQGLREFFKGKFF